MTPRKFRELVLTHYEKHGRHNLPWRKTTNPYRILVSEVMLQQTQVERVVPYYNAFLKAFPNEKALAAAPLSKVLTLWQGLGYNRRAKMLHEAAKTVVREHKGKIPTSIEALEQLPGVGHYTARAVAAFAANTDSIFIETNIRTAITHHFFSDTSAVSDAEVLAILEKAYPEGRAREWYSALMDYGSFLKRSGVRINAKSKGYTKQKPFAGSKREARGAILRALGEKARMQKDLEALLGRDRTKQLIEALAALIKEKLVEKRGAKYQLAD